LRLTKGTDAPPCWKVAKERTSALKGYGSKEKKPSCALPETEYTNKLV